jgi:uncharacterized protein YciI
MNEIQNNNRRFVYFYFNRNEPEKIRQVVAAHIAYWKTANIQGYMGGPFADRTGGLISFVASNAEEAAEVIQNDPFGMEDLIDQKWIKEWVFENHVVESSNR